MKIVIKVIGLLLMDNVLGDYVQSYHSLRTGDVIVIYGGMARVTRTTPSTVWVYQFVRGEEIVVEARRGWSERWTLFTDTKLGEHRLLKDDFHKVRVKDSAKHHTQFYWGGSIHIRTELPHIAPPFIPEQPPNA